MDGGRRDDAHRSVSGRVPCPLRRFLRPRFRHGRGCTASGSKGVLEVRTHDTPFLLEHGQIVARLVYEPLTARPARLYGEGGSHYQRQGLNCPSTSSPGPEPGLTGGDASRRRVRQALSPVAGAAARQTRRTTSGGQCVRLHNPGDVPPGARLSPPRSRGPRRLRRFALPV